MDNDQDDNVPETAEQFELRKSISESQAMRDQASYELYLTGQRDRWFGPEM